MLNKGNKELVQENTVQREKYEKALDEVQGDLAVAQEELIEMQEKTEKLRTQVKNPFGKGGEKEKEKEKESPAAIRARLQAAKAGAQKGKGPRGVPAAGKGKRSAPAAASKAQPASKRQTRSRENK